MPSVPPSDQVAPHPRLSRSRSPTAWLCSLEETLQCGKPASVEGALCTAVSQQFVAVNSKDVIGPANIHARESLQTLSEGVIQLHSRSCIGPNTTTSARSCASIHARVFRDPQCGGSVSCQTHCFESAHFTNPLALVHVALRSGVVDDALFQASPLCSDFDVNSRQRLSSTEPPAQDGIESKPPCSCNLWRWSHACEVSRASGAEVVLGPVI